MKIEQVVFNLDDPDQIRLHKHLSERRNKSGYLKRLIQRDIDGAFGIPTDFISRSSPSTELDFVAEAFI
ncbi:hypothetical protein MUG84_00060 [Paenibacillus sp. KQZ6P-2]|uniref:Uncharacterized protein n=1 Tax=Paenibacillus mangrovi TaxID=2931978 RepID=A0A9X1WJH8_9BACL|nr:hypothetical protein [Paenibacillus mangrovi]MCJ8010133.1 hypothetical protein [Paenibacillus mangrovi]